MTFTHTMAGSFPTLVAIALSLFHHRSLVRNHLRSVIGASDSE
jgi:hypothetical protein